MRGTLLLRSTTGNWAHLRWLLRLSIISMLRLFLVGSIISPKPSLI